MSSKLIEYERAFTHSGNFHADDVFSGAFLRLLNHEIEIIRGFEVPQNFDGIVFDIGGGKYDHHSTYREVRENGVIYASFGKLWREYGGWLVSDYVKKSIDEELITPLDNSDNTGDKDTLCSVIYNMNGLWNEELSKEEQDRRYETAVNFAKGILERYIEKFEATEKAQKYVLDCYTYSGGFGNGIVVMHSYAPWKEVLRHTDTKVVIYPSNRGGWNAERVENSGFEFPKEWWGKREVKDIQGFLFCHSTGFMANFDDFDNTIEAVNVAMKGCDFFE